MKSGDRFGRLTVLGNSRTVKSRRIIDVVCDCGVTKTVRIDGLQSRDTQSCGCYRLDQLRKVTVKHDMYKTRIYQTWEAMLQRCNNSKSSGYSDYGGRGITVCEDWLNFSNFYLDMGEIPTGLSLDRIDVNGNYCVDNCRWADNSLQSFNTRTPRNNTSGKVGISWDNSRGKWSAFITKNYVKINLGRFDDIEDTISARVEAEIKYFGEKHGG